TQRDGLPRRSAQTALYHIAEALVRWIAPILSFTADELWAYLPSHKESPDKPEGTVFASEWYTGLRTLNTDSEFNDVFWQQLMAVKTAVNKVLEGQRKEGLIGGALEAEVTLYCDPALQSQLCKLGDELRFVLITSAASIKPLDSATDAMSSDVPGLLISVKKSAHTKCVRCWHHREDVGAHATHPELCGRCVDNVDGPGEKRLFA